MEGAAEDCLREGIGFLPMVAETLGGWHKLAVTEVKRLTAAKARHLGQKEREALSHEFTRHSVLIMRGNSAILSNRVPMRQDAAVDGEL